MKPLLLDFDGTLVDTRRDLAEGVNLTLEELGLERLPVDAIMANVGRGARMLLRRCLDLVDPAETIARDHDTTRNFLAHYTTVLLETSAPYPGVKAGLDRLQQSRVPMAIVSNKPAAPLDLVIDGLELRNYFPVVVGGDTTPFRKPDIAQLELAADRLGVALTDCIMVGDSDVDIHAAANAGIPGLWCSWGGIHLDRPTEKYREVHSFDEVVDIALER